MEPLGQPLPVWSARWVPQTLQRNTNTRPTPLLYQKQFLNEQIPVPQYIYTGPLSQLFLQGVLRDPEPYAILTAPTS